MGFLGTLGFMMTIFGIFAVFFILLNEKTGIGTGVILCILAMGFIFLSTSIPDLGEPKTSIKNTGDYTVAGYMEGAKDKQFCYLILEEDSKVKFYVLPKDMINIVKSEDKSGILEVVEKAGFKKATLYLPANQISHH